VPPNKTMQVMIGAMKQPRFESNLRSPSPRPRRSRLMVKDVSWREAPVLPPKTLDGAAVLYWAWSESTPFFVMPDGAEGIPIHGLAVCCYAKSGVAYRFSCNRDWEVENDSPYNSAEQAMRAPSAQFDANAVRWSRMPS
jgi:hypothetical protein